MKKPAKSKKLLAVPALDPRLQALAKKFADEPRVKLEKAFSSVALKVDDKIFAMVVKGELVLKLPAPRVKELLGSGAGLAFATGGGRIMKEWVQLTGTKPSLSVLAREAFVFVGSHK